jgi:non-specific serine/threonine protein kinase
VLDAAAKADYRERLESLKEELDEARSFNDAGRASALHEELDFIAGELAAGVGLGGRSRKAASNAERARVNVQRRLKDALARIEEQSPELGRRLARAVRTGTFCVFEGL